MSMSNPQELDSVRRAGVPTWSRRGPARVAMLQKMQGWLTRTRHWSVAEIERHQARRLTLLLNHASRHSTYYRSLLQGSSAGGCNGAKCRLRDIPFLGRAILQERYAEICAGWTAAHGPAREVQTTGSTGQPVRVRRTDLCQMVWLAATLRDHLWHQRDFSRTLAAIRVAKHLPAGRSARCAGWGEATAAHAVSGPMHLLPISTDVRRQAGWLANLAPEYLLTYPSNLAALLETVAEEGLSLPRLREIRTIGEIVPDELRESVSQLPGVRLTDLYSSQELGVIALQCPTSGLYHIQAESLLVEVIDDRGQPCRPGETGRMVVTDLVNLATPLIRYEIGDYAEVGQVCPCGCNLPTLRRILGRRRNMIVQPDGSRQWPHISAARLREIVPDLKLWKLVQRSVSELEMRMLAPDGINRDQEQAVVALLRESLGYPFEVGFDYCSDGLMHGPGWKREAVVCEV